MVNARNLKDLQIECEKVGFVFQQLLIWDKGNCTLNRYYLNSYELILMLRKGKAKTIKNRGDKNILRIKNLFDRKIHPTQKPIELLKILINNSSDEKGIVLDPFSGSGSTCVACINTDRKFIGIELDKNYFEIARKRIEENL